MFVSYGKLIDINNKEIFHNFNVKEGSSGSPIFLLNNHKLIGIHCNSSNNYKYNKGILLIYSIFEFSKIKNNLLIIDKEGINRTYNFILAELEVKEGDHNIRIINSYEQYARKNKYIEYDKDNENEKEIKENCEITINGKLVPFSDFHKFNKKVIILLNILSKKI